LRMLAASERLSADDPLVIAFRDAWARGNLDDKTRIQAGFALAQALGSEGFPYLRDANALQRKAAPWSIADRQAEVAALQAALDRLPWPDVADPPHSPPGLRPIFVTGLPRSGTTLVEQILSSHPDVTAAGETGLPLRAAYSVLRTSQGGFRPVAELTHLACAQIGTRYLDGMAHFHAVDGVFTDKSIQTYMVMGLFHHILPYAKCVVVRRDPRDVGWSIYRNYFETGTHGYANDLHDIGRYAASVDEMIAFWRARRPEAFLELRYEDLVTDPEPEIRRLLEYCRLDWDPACLAPEKNTRSVATLSVDQVRAPISPASVGGWRRWAAELEPLQHALGDLAAPWD